MEKPNLQSRRYWQPYSDMGGINTLEGLDDLCQKYVNKNTVVVEMGYGFGFSASLFSYYAKIVHTIDKQCLEGKATDRFHNVFFHHGTFKKMIPRLHILYPEGVDLIYIDGAHHYQAVCDDIEIALPLVKPNGYISGHDHWMPDVGRAVKDRFQMQPELFSDSSWVIKKNEIK